MKKILFYLLLLFLVTNSSCEKTNVSGIANCESAFIQVHYEPGCTQITGYPQGVSTTYRAEINCNMTKAENFERLGCSDICTDCYINWENAEVGTMKDTRDGETYSTIKIGSQIWMAENLGYNVLGSWYSSNYGRLYTWNMVVAGDSLSAASNSPIQGICPTGWHLPSDNEWSILEIALGMSSSDSTEVGERGSHGFGMKAASGWSDTYNGSNGAGTNASGFKVIPVGFYNMGSIGGVGKSASFWSSTGGQNGRSWVRSLRNESSSVSRIGELKTKGLSCRCVKN